MDFNRKKLLNKLDKTTKIVCKSFSSIDNVIGITLGGSLARNFSDENSDIEVYVYYDNSLPNEEKIKKILKKMRAKLTRSSKIFWYHEAWGYHTFFKVNNVKVELGYRNINKIKERMHSFITKFSLPKHGIHDTPFGHYESGLASCIKEGKILYDKKSELKNLKKALNKFPEKVKINTISYYFKDAKRITHEKIKSAIKRNDTYNFNACSSRVVRSLNICLFAINDTYFPGDKWNHKYIKKFKKKPKKYEKYMSEFFRLGDLDLKNKIKKYEILKNIIIETQNFIRK